MSSVKIESPNELKNRLIEALRNDLPVLRARVGLSQEAIADKIGISRRTYSSIETGKREMAWTTFLALVAFFQNNEQTLPMLKQIEGLLEGVEKILHDQSEEVE